MRSPIFTIIGDTIDLDKKSKREVKAYLKEHLQFLEGETPTIKPTIPNTANSVFLVLGTRVSKRGKTRKIIRDEYLEVASLETELKEVDGLTEICSRYPVLRIEADTMEQMEGTRAIEDRQFPVTVASIHRDVITAIKAAYPNASFYTADQDQMPKLPQAASIKTFFSNRPPLLLPSEQ